MRVIIVGAGIAGLSVAWALIKRGHQVILFEQDRIPNPLGASGDQHRIIRRAYGDMRGYTHRMSEAFEAWDELWSDLGRSHLVPVGCMGIVLERGDRAERYREGLARDGYPFEVLDNSEAHRRYPFLNPTSVRSVFVSAEGGVLLSERIAHDLTAWLGEHGAEIHPATAIVDIDAASASVRMEKGGRLRADAVVLAAGAWVTRLVPDLSKKLVSSRTFVIYLEPPEDLRKAWRTAPAIPGIGGDVDGYVLPPVADTDLKLGASLTRQHWQGETDLQITPAMSTRLLQHFAPVFDRIRTYRIKAARNCVYTFTADEHFFAERRDSLWILSACSGHGYKFGPAIGRRLAQALTGGDIGGFTAWVEARDDVGREG